MLRNKKYGGSLLLAGLAAFAYYRYSKMSEQEKHDIVGKIRDSGKKLFDQFMPSNLKNTFASDQAAPTMGNTGEGNNFAS